MFRNRKTSQKPGEDFYSSFKQAFPHLSHAAAANNAASLAQPLRSSSLTDALIDPIFTPRQNYGSFDDVGKEREQTPKTMGGDSWRFTPSMLDPNSFSFSSFANQPPGYYTPTPGGLNTLYHSQAGDLHTPGMGMNTPLSMPHSGGALPADANVNMHHFHPSMYTHQSFVNPFVTQASFAPAQFVHQDSGFEGMEHSNHDSPLDTHGQQFNQATMGGLDMAPPALPEQDKFRYHVTLNAPTAMIKQSDEIPITYLNKGQAYTMTVADTTPLAPINTIARYRTFVRVSFEDQQQRAKPAACWQLWKEGRGTNEAHQRGGKLLAVEFVDPNQGASEDSARRPQIELESASFDGFCVTWSPNPTTGHPDCSISVRFNFLSTDFSHSKGVKGIPVRLCAKTEMITPKSPDESLITQPEVCYCKVKLFRDHGAERKLSNDVAHVKKTMEKLKQQIAQAESGVGGFGKRKRSGSMSKGNSLQRPGKVQKHKRTWSLDSQGEGTMKNTAEDDLHMKLATMQDMFSSTRPVSVLYLQGENQDDPDAFPVQIPDMDVSKMHALTRQDTLDSKFSNDVQSAASNAVSQSPSLASLGSPYQTTDRRLSGLQRLQTFDGASGQESLDPSLERSISPEQLMKVQKVDDQDAWIDAAGVDPTYQPPMERPIKPTACFYLKSSGANDIYRAVYLMQRSVRDLSNAISEKFQVDPSTITRIIRVNAKGLKIAVDEDVVRELPEGQDMTVSFANVSHENPVQLDRKIDNSRIQADSIIPAASASTSGVEIRLAF